MRGPDITLSIPVGSSVDVVDRHGFTDRERVTAVVIGGQASIRLGRLGITRDEDLVALAGQLRTAFDELHRNAIERIRLAAEGRPTDPCRLPVCPVNGEHARWSLGCVQQLVAEVAG